MLLLDHAEKVGKKILISGGGRCNFTNLDARPEAFLSANPHFCKSALARYTPHDFIALVDKHGIAWHEKTLGQLFCDGSARQIVAMLLAECAAAGVDVRVGASHRPAIEKADRFVVRTDQGEFDAPSLVMATRRPVDPEDGRDRLRYDIARRFGLAIAETRPAWCRSRCEGAGARTACRFAVDGALRQGRRSARPCCSPIAACRARRSCRSRPTGARAGDRARPAARPRCGSSS